MQVLLFIIVIGWLTTLPAVVWWCLGAVVLVGLGLCGYCALDQIRPPRKRCAAVDPTYVAALETLVSKAQAEVEALRAEVDRLRSAARAAKAEKRAEPEVTIHRRVGLSENAPQWLIAAARRAYRSQLHPDRHPPRIKAEAERRFIEAEGIFDQIEAPRAQ
jgi:hypothetical protein